MVAAAMLTGNWPVPSVKATVFVVWRDREDIRDGPYVWGVLVQVLQSITYRGVVHDTARLELSIDKPPKRRSVFF